MAEYLVLDTTMAKEKRRSMNIECNTFFQGELSLLCSEK